MKSTQKVIKAYNGCPIAEEGAKTLSVVTAQEIVEAGEMHNEKVDIFVPAVQPFNDKSKGAPTPRDIYLGDINQLKQAEVVFFNITGGMQDGTNSEIGVVTGLNEATIADMVSHKLEFDMFESKNSWLKALSELLIISIAYSTSGRLAHPQHFYGIASASANHLILGMLDEWGAIYPTKQEMIDDLRKQGVSKIREELVTKISNRIIEDYGLTFKDDIASSESKSENTVNIPSFNCSQALESVQTQDDFLIYATNFQDTVTKTVDSIELYMRSLERLMTTTDKGKEENK